MFAGRRCAEGRVTGWPLTRAGHAGSGWRVCGDRSSPQIDEKGNRVCNKTTKEPHTANGISDNNDASTWVCSYPSSFPVLPADWDVWSIYVPGTLILFVMIFIKINAYFIMAAYLPVMIFCFSFQTHLEAFLEIRNFRNQYKNVSVSIKILISIISGTKCQQNVSELVRRLWKLLEASWTCGPPDMKLLIFINSNKGRTVLRLQIENRSMINGHLNTMSRWDVLSQRLFFILKYTWYIYTLFTNNIMMNGHVIYIFYCVNEGTLI